ncbi:hypothetical protein HZC35_04415 [Candidatus Saganbacteria bacterium]|nr:hypothetical protein [Candidatus Saganbacteria bacterium]
MSNQVNISGASGVSSHITAKGAAPSVASGMGFMSALQQLYNEPQRVLVESLTQTTTDLKQFGIVENGTSGAYLAIAMYTSQAQAAFNSAFDILVQQRDWAKQLANMV